MSEAGQKAEATPKLPTFGRERLSPGAYALDLSAVRNIPVKCNGELSTFGDLYLKLTDLKIERMESGFRQDKYVTDKGEIEVDCEWTIAATMRELIELTRQGIDPYRVTWFYYGFDWSRDADIGHAFFAVHGGKIVAEACHFSSEEPLVLKQKQDPDPIWHSHAYFDQAVDRYWYRKFYSDTMTGQLMVLRPDEPILYHYERPPVRDAMRDVEFVTLIKMYHLLWIVIPLLAAIAFPSIKWYMAAVAALLTIDVLWRAWTSRNAGS